MYLGAVREDADEIDSLLSQLETVRARRDARIRDMLNHGVPKSRIARYARLSRPMLYNIQLDGRADLSEPLSTSKHFDPDTAPEGYDEDEPSDD